MTNKFLFTVFDWGGGLRKHFAKLNFLKKSLQNVK